jgi:resolvase-like protein
MMAETMRAGMCLRQADAATDAEMHRQDGELTAILNSLVLGYEWHAALMALLSCVDTKSTAVMYARVSSKDQEREGFSIPAQQKLLREYARNHKLTVLKDFVDVETAKQAGRSQFGEMIAFLRVNPTCRTILVEKTACTATLRIGSRSMNST